MLIKSRQLELYIMLSIVAFTSVFFVPNNKESEVTVEEHITEAKVEYVTHIVPDAEVTLVVEEKKPKKPKKQEPVVSKKEKELLAVITMAEAEGESERGKRLVIDTVLNRVDSKKFPNTITT